MELEELMQLIDAVSESKLTDFRYEENGVKLCMKKETGAAGAVCTAGMAGAFMPGMINTADMAASGTASAGMAGAAVPATANAAVLGAVNTAGAEAVQDTKRSSFAAVQAAGTAVSQEAEPPGNIVKSPLVGVFYAAPAEDAKPYVSVGDTVKKGQILACIEAMKLMNEIESEFDGMVAEVLVENGQGVGYGEPLFVIR